MVPLALPAIVLALGVLWTWLAIPLPVYGTIAILVIAFAARSSAGLSSHRGERYSDP